MWLRCRTQEEIAEMVGIAQNSVSVTLDNIKKGKLSEIDNPPDSFQTFNLWNFQNNDPRYGVDYPGRIPGQIIENVLYYYTQPFEMVIDPFGGGTTLDVCKVR